MRWICFRDDKQVFARQLEVSVLRAVEAVVETAVVTALVVIAACRQFTGPIACGWSLGHRFIGS